MDECELQLCFFAQQATHSFGWVWATNWPSAERATHVCYNNSESSWMARRSDFCSIVFPLRSSIIFLTLHCGWNGFQWWIESEENFLVVPLVLLRKRDNVHESPLLPYVVTLLLSAVAQNLTRREHSSEARTHLFAFTISVDGVFSRVLNGSYSSFINCLKWLGFSVFR